jgi:hypothetical protein
MEWILERNSSETKHFPAPQTSLINSISVPAIRTRYGIINRLGIKTPYYKFKKLTLTQLIGVLEKGLLDAPGSDLEARCLFS